MIHGTDVKGYLNNDYIIVDGTFTPHDALADLVKNDRHEVYEVLRVKNGKPLFLEEHYTRFTNSLSSKGRRPVVTKEEFFAQIDELIRLCGVHNQNMRIDQFIDTEDGKEHILAYLVATSFPSAEQYRDGVDIGYLDGERNDPTAKIYDRPLRELADDALRRTGFYEVMLVDRNGNITENSRSNLFFIKDGTVYSAPLETILPGLTRLKVLKLLESHSIPYVEQTIPADSVAEYDSAFLTATSPEVLPVAHAVAEEGQPYPTVAYDVNDPLLRALMAWYGESEE